LSRVIDIAHWKDIKEMTGVSVRTILLNIFFQLVIFLYLMDNSQETSWLILIGQCVGLGIEVWKIKKAVDIKVWLECRSNVRKMVEAPCVVYVLMLFLSTFVD
jgi:hypothetical protein